MALSLGLFGATYLQTLLSSSLRLRLQLISLRLRLQLSSLGLRSSTLPHLCGAASQLSQSVCLSASQVHQGGLDWPLRRRQVQSPLQVHQERVQPRVQVHCCCRVCWPNRSSRPRFGTLLAKKGTYTLIRSALEMPW